MTNKELFYFTGKCLMLDEKPEFAKVIVATIIADKIDWQKFVTMCSNHLILPSIYLKFKSHGILNLIPPELTEHLKDIYTLNLNRNNQILEQLQEITELMNKNNIFPVFLKGTGNLLDDLYADRGERMLGDIDFLVPKNDFLFTIKLMQDDGYGIDTPFSGEIKNFKHYPRIGKSGFPADLEIHQSAVSKRFISWFNPEMIFRDKKSTPALKGCYVLSDNQKIILNFIHGQLDHKGHLNGIVSFRDLYDLYLISKRAPLKETIPQIKTAKMAIAYFALARKSFGLNENFFSGNNFSAWFLTKKHDLNKRSTIFYYTYKSLIFLGEQIFMKYFWQIIQSFYRKEVRQSLITRLSNPQWYRGHFQYYATFFKVENK